VGVSSVERLRRAVFLDRDGVLNKAIVREGRPFPPASAAEVELVEGIEAALALLKQHGFALIVVSNQPDVARGATSLSDVESINATLAAALPVDEFFVCYHDDTDECACRKPKPGLYFDAARKWQIDRPSSFAIGDRWRDVDSAAKAGVRPVFLDYGYAERRPTVTPGAIVTNVMDGAQWIVANSSSKHSNPNSLEN
jgi:D-glycero-D-manno-heptose 1,7-bisphosphate phosphatase